MGERPTCARPGPARRRIARGLLAAALIAAAAPGGPARAAAACDAGPVPQILARLRTASDVADPAARRAAVARLLARWADGGAIARAALHRRWAGLAAAGRARFRALLRRLATARASVALARDGVAAFAVLGARPITGNDCLVASRVVDRRGRPRIVHWRMRSGPAGPRFVDLLIDGVSLVRNLRDELDAILHDNHGDLADLAVRLRTTIARVERAGR